MNLFSQLLVSLISAAVATVAVVSLGLAGPVQLGITIAIATCIPPLVAALWSKPAAGASAYAGETAREEGSVKWFNVSKGFGFIKRANGEEVFVHFRSIRGPNQGRRSLRDGQRVSYVVVDSDKGPQAEDVEALPN